MIKKLLVISLLIFFLVSLLLYFFQRRLIYFPAKEMPNRQLFHAEDMQQVKLHTADGLYLNAWYKPAKRDRSTILYLHGNAGNLAFAMPLMRQFLRLGLGVLLVDYRGYGGNAGKPSEQGLYQDGRAALTFLLQQGVEARNLVFYGESLGTGVATKLASEAPACALILQSPYTSLTALAHYHYPWLLIGPWDKFDSLARIDKIEMPLLILHGKRDEIVPFKQGKLLFNKAKKPKYFVTFSERGHYNLWDLHFFNEVCRFINTYCS